MTEAIELKPDTRCSVCGNPKGVWAEYCNSCEQQKERVAEIRRQKKRDEAFGNPWKIAGGYDD